MVSKQLIEMIKNYAHKGISYSEIAKCLTEAKVKTSTGKTKWNKSQVYRVLVKNGYAKWQIESNVADLKRISILTRRSNGLSKQN